MQSLETNLPASTEGASAARPITLKGILREAPAVAAKSLAVGVATLGITFLITPTFTARSVVVAPQGQSSTAAAAMASLGSLASLAGGAIKTPGDQYVSMLQSENVANRIVDKFKLMDVYEVEFRVDARKRLGQNARIGYGKKDGLISIEVDDHDPQRAADIANQFVAEMRRLSTEFTLSEAQQRRAFFEARLKEVSERLKAAQARLEAGGMSTNAIKAEPKAAAESLAKLNAELTAATVRLEALRQSMTDSAPEVQRQQATVSALRGQVQKMSTSDGSGSSADYLGNYREFKYNETLFDIFSRQYELARADEAKEAPIVQVIDVAEKPERKSRPKRGLSAMLATLAAAFLFGSLHLHRMRRG